MVMSKDIQKTSVIAATIVITTIALVPVASVLAQPAFPVAGGKYNFGTISSVQLDKNSKPDWILSGHWRSNLLSISSSNQTNNTTAPVFGATFEMVMVNGSGLHRHSLANFALTKISTPNKGTTEFNGTAAISLTNGPASEVPISIKFMGNHTISIWLDPSKIQNHFGNTPIFGTVFEPLSNFAVGPPRMNLR
jgi:hypothetical protein